MPRNRKVRSRKKNKEMKATFTRRVAILREVSELIIETDES